MAQLAHEISDIRAQVSEQEWRLRVDLAAAYRLVEHYGWTDMVFTHLSARVPGPEHHFLINPYGMMFDEITASNLVKIDLDGEVVLDNGYPVNPAGFTIHSAIHMAREDAQAVMHLHTDDGVAVSSMSEGLMPINQTSMIIHDEIAYHEYEGVALDLDERERLVADLGDKMAMMLRNHGTLAVGQTVSDCFLMLYTFERACTMQVRAMTSTRLHQPSETSIETTRRQGREIFRSGAAGALAWPALLRLVERIGPDYKT
ncbi:MAG: class II aldolase/adducin family protein [Pseudomonadota bacterium]